MTNRCAFTLIELLIVVAIIGILAAIAVPNFLNAQTRARIARTESDARAIGVSLETYALDSGGRYVSNSDRPGIRGDGDIFDQLSYLTTPISYIATVPLDPFYNPEDVRAASGGGMYGYFNYGEFFSHSGRSGGIQTLIRLTQQDIARPVVYSIISLGPDRKYQGGLLWIYHASNGLNSGGDIFRWGP